MIPLTSPHPPSLNPARYYGVNDHRRYQAQAQPLELQDIVPRAYRLSCRVGIRDQSVDGQHYFFTGEKLHGITHSQALFNLSTLGYPALARKGLHSLNKQLELNEKRPQQIAVQREVLDLDVLDESFWGHGFEDLHAIKLAYSAIELNTAFGDERIPLEQLAGHFAFLK